MWEVQHGFMVELIISSFGRNVAREEIWSVSVDHKPGPYNTIPLQVVISLLQMQQNERAQLIRQHVIAVG